MRSYVGSLLWLSLGTRPDLATITNILAKYQANLSAKHIAAAKYAIKYLKGTKNLGITFSSKAQNNNSITSFLNFPVNTPTVSALCDANWGPQDQSVPKSNITQQLDFFKSRSISGHIITLFGPLTWSSKRQTITARSSAEAKIYATDECVKKLLHIRNIVQDLNLQNEFINDKIKIYNDNMACVLWTSNKTTKGLQYIQIREYDTKENIHLFDIQHVAGKVNIADIFSKEVKDQQQFVNMHDIIVTPPFNATNEPVTNEFNSMKRKNSMTGTDPNPLTLGNNQAITNENGARATIEISVPTTTSTNQYFQSVKLTKANQSTCSSYSFDKQHYSSNPNYPTSTNNSKNNETKTYISILLSTPKNSRQKTNRSIRWKLTKLNQSF